jgi:hypothetical protein
LRVAAGEHGAADGVEPAGEGEGGGGGEAGDEREESRREGGEAGAVVVMSG